MIENPLISVIVPVYNVEAYLKRCVESIRIQTYENLEIILIDDGSTDNSGVICDQYAQKDQRVKVIHKENGGLSDARNSALDIMTGAYVACIDSDDFVSSYYIENLYHAAVWSKSAIACSWFVDFYDGDNVPVFTPVASDKMLVLSREEFYKKMLYQDGVEVSAWGKLYRSDLFEGVRYPKYKLYEDIPTTYRLVEKVDTIAVIPNIDYCYYQRKGSIAQGNFNLRKMDAVNHMSALKDYMIQHYPNLEKAAKCRYFSTVCNILFLIQDDAFKAERNFLWGEVKKIRNDVLLDNEGRKKARLAALISYMGRNILSIVYRLS